MTTAAKPVLLEYNFQRPLLRMFFGLLEAMAFVGYQHGYTAKLPLSPTICTGGWAEGFQFLGYFLCLATFIETIHWIAWRVQHRKEILSTAEERTLFGTPIRSQISDRSPRAGGVQELFSPSAAAQQIQPIVDTPHDYELVESGGRLPLTPRRPVLAILFGLGLVVLVLIRPGFSSIDSCALPSFSWTLAFGRLLFAYAFLAFGSLAETRIVDRRPKSAVG